MLDLVAEELDAERLTSGARKDVDETAAHGDLPALFDPLDALVAGQRELLDEAVEAALQLGAKTDRRGSLACGRDPLGERACGDADEAAALEHLECTGALPDEVGRRLEAGAGPNAAARKEGDTRRLAVPAHRLGDVARLFVLGQ